MSDSKTRTITLTDRPPVKINDDNWPLIASASDSEHDGQVESQANRKSKWFIGVRASEDATSRYIVYATYSYMDNYQGSRSFAPKHGILLDNANYPDERGMAQVVEAIKQVSADMERMEHHDDDAKRWPTLANECIADLPAEDIDAPKEGDA